jgi:hypothetical protein
MDEEAPMLTCLAYASLSNVPAWSPEMLELARTCLARNPALGITGALYFDGTQFYQVIEGEETAVHALFERIEADPRHSAVQPLWDGPIAQRRFGNWAMKFVDGSTRPEKLRPRFCYAEVLERDRAAQPRLFDTLVHA